jgi:hypothetical protein
MPAAGRKPWIMLMPLAGVVFLAAVWCLYWFVALGMIEERMAAERRLLAEHGLRLECTSERWGGFPFHFEFACSSPVISFEDRYEIGSQDLLLVALAYAPWQVVALVDGATRLTREQVPTTTLEHRRAIVAVTLDRQWRPQVSAEIPLLTAAGYGRVDRLMIHARPSAEGLVDIAVSWEGLSYHPAGRPPFSVAVGKGLGVLAGGPILKVKSVEFQEGTVRYWGSGELNLDGARRVSGKLSTETNDINGLLALVQPQLGFTDRQEAALRTMLGLLGGEARADIIARDGQLYVGPFRVAELMPLY